MKNRMPTVRRLDEIFEHIAVAVVELLLTHLRHQRVVERLLLCKDGLFLLVAPLASTLIDGQVFVVTSDIFQSGIKGIAAFLTLALDVKVIGGIGVFYCLWSAVPGRKVIVGHRLLQRRIVV